MLTNQLDNAVKFSPREGRVVVDVAVVPAAVTISVTDHGRGIPAAMREKVFVPFARSTHRTVASGAAPALACRSAARSSADSAATSGHHRTRREAPS